MIAGFLPYNFVIMPAEKFKFQQNDPVLQQYLSATERGNIAQWQANTEYDFEFHFGHLTGNPVYIRPDACEDDTSRIPKFDTINSNSGMYNTITKFRNHAKLTSNLSNTAQTEIVQLVGANWASFVLLAQRYYKDGPPDADETPEDRLTRLWAIEESLAPEPKELRSMSELWSTGGKGKDY